MYTNNHWTKEEDDFILSITSNYKWYRKDLLCILGKSEKSIINRWNKVLSKKINFKILIENEEDIIILKKFIEHILQECSNIINYHSSDDVDVYIHKYITLSNKIYYIKIVGTICQGMLRLGIGSFYKKCDILRLFLNPYITDILKRKKHKLRLNETLIKNSIIILYKRDCFLNFKSNFDLKLQYKKISNY